MQNEINSLNFTIPDNIYSVESLNNTINQHLQKDFRAIFVEGEISNLVKAASGHYYFTLKDSKAQIKCVLFLNTFRIIKTKQALANGQKIIIKASISVYVPRGDYQLIVENIYPTGVGALQLAFEQLKQKLIKEGLFDKIHKKPIPTLPKNIWVITSPSGAAIRDIIVTVKRRCCNININIIPTLVQGNSAVAGIINGLTFADQHSNPTTDVILLARGGGSIEDLWAFNDEELARIIFKAKTPIISGIGHETDFTIADFVADLRAATPTAAAEAATPNQNEYLNIIQKLNEQILKIWRGYITAQQQKLEHLNHRLIQLHPQTKIQNQLISLDETYSKLFKILRSNIKQATHQLKIKAYQLKQNNPEKLIYSFKNRLIYNKKILNNEILKVIHNNKNILLFEIKKLNATNPLEILSLGYSILEDIDGNLISNQDQVKTGDKIKAKLYQGEIYCEVVSKL